LEPNWEVPKIQLLKYDDVAQQVHKLDDLTIEPDYTSLKSRGLDCDTDPGWDVINLQKVNFTDAGTVQVPGFGLLKLNNWSKRQLGARLGVKWDKFFGETPPDKINRAVTDHLENREPVIMKVVARKHAKEEGNIEADGVLRGLVSPSYSEIRDARLIDRIGRILGPRLDEMSFTKYEATVLGSHFVIAYNKKVDLLGAGKANDMIGGTAYYGLRIRNSEVGAYSLTGVGYFLRVICSNGMIVGIEGEQWLHRRHIFLDNSSLDKILKSTLLERLPNSRDEIISNTQKLNSMYIEEPEKTIKNYLSRKQQPKTVQEAAIEAYNKEPISTAYGILQSLTRLAMSVRHDQDRQYDLEAIAGEYLNDAVKGVT
jgi:hypothetical protein